MNRKKMSSAERRLLKLSREWFQPDSPMAGIIDEILREIQQYKHKADLYNQRCENLQDVIKGIDNELSTCKEIF